METIVALYLKYDVIKDISMRLRAYIEIRNILFFLSNGNSVN